MIPTEKACTKCKLIKPMEAFSSNKHKRDGRGSWCRKCCAQHVDNQRGKAAAQTFAHRDYATRREPLPDGKVRITFGDRYQFGKGLITRIKSGLGAGSALEFRLMAPK